MDFCKEDLRFHYALKIINVMFVYGVWNKGWNIPISERLKAKTDGPKFLTYTGFRGDLKVYRDT